MGFINNAYAAYQNTGIKTASQGKLVVLLYEGAIKNLTNALECFDSDSKIEAKNIEKFGNYIMLMGLLKFLKLLQGEIV